MDIDDLLQQERFKGLDNYLTDLMNDTASDDVLKQMEAVFGNLKLARNWYFSGIPSLDGVRPYDFCERKEYETILNLLGKIEHSIP